MPRLVNSKLKIVNGIKKSIHYSPFTINIKVKQGFTLIELLVVVSLVGILVAIAAISFDNLRQKGRDGVRKQDLNSLKTTLVLHYQDKKAFPGTPGTNYASNNSNSWIAGLAPTYIDKLPQDPVQTNITSPDCAGKTHIYCYQVAADGSFVLWAQLENVNDKEIVSQPSSPCNLPPPSPVFNYCVKSPSL